MASAFTKFDNFAVMRADGDIALTSDVLKVYLSNTAPNVATMTGKADLAEIATGNGYTGAITPVTSSFVLVAGQVSIAMESFRLTATGTIGPFRYLVLYNSSSVSPANALIGYWDLGSYTMGNGDAHDFKFNAAAIGVAGVVFIVL